MLTDLTAVLSAACLYARRCWMAAVLESYRRTPRALTKYLERRNLRGPTEKVSAVLWLSGAQGWVQAGLEDELSVTTGLLFLACGMAGTWLGRRLFG